MPEPARLRWGARRVPAGEKAISAVTGGKEDVLEFDALVIGEALMDITRTPLGGDAEHVGGSPANVALGLGRLGRSVALLTQLGDDDRGDRIRGHLGASGVQVVGAPADHTSTAVATIGPDGSAEYDFDITWGRFESPSDLTSRVIHTGSLAVFLAPGADAVDEVLRAAPAGTTITLDPNIRPALVGAREPAVARFEALARRSQVVKMSDEDADFLFPGESIDAVLDRLLHGAVKLAAVTRGAAGSVLASAHGRVAVPAPRVNVIDTIGAGDTFMVSLIDDVLSDPDATGGGLDEDALTRIGTRAVELAAITVARAGADLPTARPAATGA
ncbi:MULTISPECIES: carbohydrate kinase [Microbacterium]|uniref:carbohydrate kinase family protein n=1 Tax=Microbacterium TaxID=33882 RepID=UPI00278371BB|nr:MULTISPECIES: carbohydrate kinase [Microbacterium]MDQ1082472.1 fructokinase [Microbacterium sp. SORGH_AS_0344]MDQ1168757.1 fructokinase [Microbacterium proteolyticum]